MKCVVSPILHQLSLPKFEVIDLQMISCGQALPLPLVPPSSNSSLSFPLSLPVPPRSNSYLFQLVPFSHRSSLLLCPLWSYQASSLLSCPAQSPSSPSAKSHLLLMVPSSLPLPPFTSKPFFSIGSAGPILLISSSPALWQYVC